MALDFHQLRPRAMRLAYASFAVCLPPLAGCNESSRALLTGRNLEFAQGQTRHFRVTVQESTGRWKLREAPIRPRAQDSRLNVRCRCPAFLSVRDVGRLEMEVHAPGVASAGWVGVFGDLEMTVAATAPRGEHQVEIEFSHPAFSAAVIQRVFSPGALDAMDSARRLQILKELNVNSLPASPQEFAAVYDKLVAAAGGPSLRAKLQVTVFVATR